MECTHLLDNVKVQGDLFFDESSITKNLDCSGCGVREQNWLCLACGAVNCGRYANAHAKTHAETHDHQLCISCEVYSVYCYKCDDYVSNDTENSSIDKIRKHIMQLRNDSETNSNSRLGENGCEEQNSVSNERDEQNKLLDNGDDKAPVDSQQMNLYSDASNSSSTQDTGDNKAVKSPNKNTEEPARSLRPRARKRSHSEDSSSAENTIQTKSKEKKASPSCNGKSKEKKVVGLKNLGNTCFMNAVLQSLSNIQEFSCYFSQLPSLESKANGMGRKVYHSRSYTRQEMHDVIMAEELRKVLINLNNGCGTKGAISPECLFLVIWKVVPRFRGYQQQDAHEFLRYMLDRLHTELLQLVPGERVEPGFISKSPAASIVTAVFGGTLQSEVRCLACGTDSKKLDPFLDLSLELPDARPDHKVSLEDCLASFVQVEELADTERYFCSNCKCKQKSTKQFWIRRLPNVLCLHLKRFRWHNYFRTKLETVVRFPLRALQLSALTGPPRPRTPRRAPLYDLAAVVVHHGSGAGSGHYTAFAINEEQWFHFNDQTVRAAAPAAVAACKPYILFYIRRHAAFPSRHLSPTNLDNT